jgi:hypothetical protein
VVETALSFGGLEAFLDRPPRTGHGSDLAAVDGVGVKAQVVGDIGGIVAFLAVTAATGPKAHAGWAESQSPKSAVSWR